MLVCNIEIVLKELSIPNLNEPHCTLTISKQQSKSQPFSASPISFSNISTKDLLTLTISDDQKEVATADIPLKSLIKPGIKACEQVFSLKGLQDKEEKGSVTMTVTSQIAQRFFKLEKLVGDMSVQIDQLKTTTHLYQGKSQGLAQTLMAEELQSLRNQIQDSHDARKQLQDSISQTSNQFQLFHQDSLGKLENSAKETKQVTEKLREQEQANKKLLTKQSENKEKLDEMSTENEVLKSKINQLQTEAQTADSLRQQLKEAWASKEKLSNDYEASLKEFATNSKQLQNQLQKVSAQKSQLLDELESVKSELQNAQKENDNLNQALLQVKSELAQHRSNANLIESLRKKEKQQADLIKSLQQANSKLESQLQQVRSSTEEKLKVLSENYQALLAEKNKADQAYCELQNQLDQKQDQLKKLSNTLSDKEVSLVSLEQHLCSQQDLNQIFDQLRSQNAAHVQQKSKLVEDNELLTNKIAEQAQEIQNAQKQIEELEAAREKSESENQLLKQYISDMKKRKLYVPIKDDPIDIALADFVNTKSPPLGMKFTREDTGVYYFGTKRIFVKLEQGKVIIRVGGGFMQIQDFLQMYSPVELEKFENRQRDQAQKTRHSLYGKYASSLITESPSPNRRSPNNQTQNQFSPYFAIQKRSTNSPLRNTPSPTRARKGKTTNNINQ